MVIEGPPTTSFWSTTQGKCFSFFSSAKNFVVISFGVSSRNLKRTVQSMNKSGEHGGCIQGSSYQYGLPPFSRLSEKYVDVSIMVDPAFDRCSLMALAEQEGQEEEYLGSETTRLRRQGVWEHHLGSNPLDAACLRNLLRHHKISWNCDGLQVRCFRSSHNPIPFSPVSLSIIGSWEDFIRPNGPNTECSNSSRPIRRLLLFPLRKGLQNPHPNVRPKLAAYDWRALDAKQGRSK